MGGGGGRKGVSRGVTCASSTQKKRGERVTQNYFASIAWRARGCFFVVNRKFKAH